MEQCQVSKFFNVVGESQLTLQSILHCCVLDEQVIKGLEGYSQYLIMSKNTQIFFAINIK